MNFNEMKLILIDLLFFGIPILGGIPSEIQRLK